MNTTNNDSNKKQIDKRNNHTNRDVVVITYKDGTGRYPKIHKYDGVYDIYDAKELAWIAQQTNSGNSDFNGCTIRLQADLDLGNIEWWEIGTNNTPFRGSFEGNNHVISNPLYWSGKSEGIFGKVESIQYSSFQNVTVDNCNINAFGWGTGGFGGLIANINGLGGSKTIISNIVTV